MNFGLVLVSFLIAGDSLHKRPLSVWKRTVTQSEEGKHTFDLFL